MLRQDVFFKKHRLNILNFTAFKYFVIFEILFKNLQNVELVKSFREKKSKSLVPAKYKLPYFYWSIYRNREKNKPSIYTCIFSL